MKTTALITLSVLVLLLTLAEAQTKKCKCRGKRGPRGLPGQRGKTGQRGPPGSVAGCKLVFKTGPTSKQERETGSLNFNPPILSVGSTCPTGYTAVSCDCNVNSFLNGPNQVRTKLVGFGTFSTFCLCNFEYLRGFSEKIEISAQVNCLKLQCGLGLTLTT